jgi:hypothetical protein
MSLNLDKGKGVDPNERTPLLISEPSSSRSVSAGPSSAVASSSVGSIRVEPSEIESNSGAERRHGNLINILIVLCSLLFGACLFLGLLLASYIPSSKERDDLQDAVVFHGPTGVQVLNITSSGLWLEVEGYMGIDIDKILGVNQDDVCEGQRGAGAQWWESARTAFGRSLVHALGPIEVSSLQGLEVWSTAGIHSALLSATIPVVIPIPMTTQVNNISFDQTVWSMPPWLTAIRIPVHVRPEASPKNILSLAKKAWAEGSIDIELRVGSIRIKAVEDRGWRGYISRTERDIRVPMTIDSKSPVVSDMSCLPLRICASEITIFPKESCLIDREFNTHQRRRYMPTFPGYLLYYQSLTGLSRE